MERTRKRPRRAFTPEFKAGVVELCRRGGEGAQRGFTMAATDGTCDPS